MEKDTKIDRGKKERVKSIALKANKESSDDETSTSGSDDREYAISVRNFKKFFRRKGKFVRQPRAEKRRYDSRQRDGEERKRVIGNAIDYGDLNHHIGELSKNLLAAIKIKRPLLEFWSDSINERPRTKLTAETCLMAH
ncbi:hypothetical protein Tco_1248500 [Tanacetum coccineum]